jgi:hypothetical protein
VALVVSESPAVPAVLERELARAAVALGLETVPVAALERELVQAEAVLVRGHPRAQLEAALRTKSVTAAHHPDLVPLLEVEEDLAAAVAETTREPAAAEAVIAWEVADTVAAAEDVAEVADTVAVAGAAVAVAEAAAVAAVAAEDAEDNERR